MHSVHTSDDTHVFVLDDEGVLFSAARQELCTLTTSATFLWCCLDQGLEFGEIVSAYAETFNVPNVEARRHVTDTLSQWDALGYIAWERPPALAVTPVDLVTALGRLLTNPSLRADFRRSPAALADRLAVRATDRMAFVAMDPEKLDAQASVLADRQKARRVGTRDTGTATVVASSFDKTGVLVEAAVAARMRTADVAERRFYRMLSTTFCIGYGSQSQENWVHPVLAHLEFEPPAKADVVIDLLEGHTGHLVLRDIVPVAHCARLEQLAPLVKSHILRIAIDRYPFFLHFHAGVVALGGAALLLPGAPGSGKSTLTAGLALSGFGYVSDEVALFDDETLAVPPVPLSLGIKLGAVEVLTPIWPHLRDLPVHRREDGKEVRYLNPAGTVSATARLPIRWIVFPTYAPTETTRLEPLPRPEALRRLMRECLTVPKPLDRWGVERLVQWMRGVSCYALPMGSLEDAVALVAGLCESADADSG
jgi:hypothetical protein